MAAERTGSDKVVTDIKTPAQTGKRPEQRLSVLAVSHGIAIGPAVFWRAERSRPLRIQLTNEQIDSECLRLQTAVTEAIRQIRELALSGGAAENPPVAGIMDVHVSIIQASSFIKKIDSVIRNEKVNAEWALSRVSRDFIERQASAADEKLKEKQLDIADVAERLQRALAGSDPTVKHSQSGSVIIADNLRPSTVVELAKLSPAAIITARAGWTSHTAILARELELPMVSGVNDLSHLVSPGDLIVVDAIDGEVIIDPSAHTVGAIESKRNGGSTFEFLRSANNELKTLDGTEVLIRANADSPRNYNIAFELGARGIGLFRSEALVVERDQTPSEDDQLTAYVGLAEAVGLDGLRIRTFDIADQIGISDRNPALGLRSLRLSLLNETQFRTQIRAILRAADGRSVDIILPMVSGVSEIRRCKELISNEKVALVNDGLAAGEPRLGAMIEVPSAVLSIQNIVDEVEFLCLGTNDLVQYLLAVDRDNVSVANWYQSLHPAVITAIQTVLSAGIESDIPVTVCGEMAGSPFYVPILLGLGARELSMNISSIHRVRHLIAGISLQECQALTQPVRESKTAEQAEQYLKEYYRRNWNGLFPPGLLDARHR